MNISIFSVKRPVLTTMVCLIICILGGISLYRLPIDLMPEITYPTLSISTSYENASSREIEEMISRPLEEALAVVPGIEEITSTSTEGSSSIRMSFSWGTDLEAASNDIRDRVDRIIGKLPEEASRPRLRKFDLASFPILICGVSSNLDPVQMRKMIDDEIKYRIERLPGVAALDVRGGLDREIHINLNPDRVKALEIPLPQIRRKIIDENVNMPVGTVFKDNFEIMVRTDSQYKNFEELKHIVVAVKNGVPVRLMDIAEVEDKWQRVNSFTRINGRPGLRLSIQKQAGTNTVQVAELVLKEIENINRDFPQFHLITIIDSSAYIKSSIRNVTTAIFFGGLLAIFVLLIFLRNIRSTIIIATAIPISIISTFIIMYFGNFTLNIMTLGGLALGIGMLVDNAIVVLDNIMRHGEKTEDSKIAAVAGSTEVMSAIVASTLTTLAVFLPLIFVKGMAGVMFKQLAMVISFSLFSSLIIALTLVPMLSSRILKFNKTETEKNSKGIFGLLGKMFTWLEDSYKEILELSLKHRFITIFLTIILFVSSFFLVPLIGVEFMPQADEGELRISVEMEVGTRIDIMNSQMMKIEKIINDSVPEIDSMVVRIGSSGWRSSGANSGNFRIALKSGDERQRSSEEIANILRKKLSLIPGVAIRIRASGGLFIFRMGQQDSDKLEVEIRGFDLDTAAELSLEIEKSIADIDGITDTKISRESGNPEDIIVIDRDRTADMKLTVVQIAEMLRTVISGSRAGYYHEDGEQYRILVKFSNSEKISVDDLLNLTINNSEGIPVVLKNVVRIEHRTGPMLIERKDQERIIKISANITERDMGSVLKDIRSKIQTVPVPRGFSVIISGDYEEQQKAFRELMMSFILALILVYMVMASQYESLLDPFIVMFSVPFAAIGVIIILFLTKTTFNVQSFIGCIMLGGIVVNNAILLVDHINVLNFRDRLSLNDSITEGGRRRLRPVLMTALTTILGMIPLAIGLGDGGEAQAPMARAVIGGLISSTLITLVFVPVICSIFKKDNQANDLKN